MKIENTIEYDIIMDFLSETLPYDDLKEFKNNIKKGNNFSTIFKEIDERSKTDKRIQNQIQLRKDIKTAIMEFDDTEYFRSQIAEFEGKTTKIININRKWWITAASILLIATISIVFFRINKDKKASLDSLFAEYYKPLKTKKLYNISQSTSFKLAKKNYDEGNYQEAIILFESLPSTINIEDEKNLFTGISYIEIENYNKAIEILNSMTENSTPSIKAQILWYLSLCYIKTGKIDDAAKSLNIIIDNKLKYKSQAEELLKKIN